MSTDWFESWSANSYNLHIYIRLDFCPFLGGSRFVCVLCVETPTNLSPVSSSRYNIFFFIEKPAANGDIYVLGQDTGSMGNKIRATLFIEVLFEFYDLIFILSAEPISKLYSWAAIKTESRRTRRQQHTKPGTGLEWTTRLPWCGFCVIIGTPTTQPRWSSISQLSILIYINCRSFACLVGESDRDLFACQMVMFCDRQTCTCVIGKRLTYWHSLSISLN